MSRANAEVSSRFLSLCAIGIVLYSLLPTISLAQWENCSIRVTKIDGLLAPDTIGAGDTIVFHIQYYNPDVLTTWAMANGFKVYSRESLFSGSVGSGTATWTITPPIGRHFTWNFPVQDGNTGVQIDTVGYFRKQNFGSAVGFKCEGCDGVGADTVRSFAGTMSPSFPGMPAGDSVMAYVIWIVTRLEDSGKVICLDSVTNYSKGQSWAWVTPCGPACDAWCLPDWSGPHCFVLAAHPCCVGRTGNIDCSANGVVDITDVTFLIDHLYINHQPLCCSEQANCDGVDGVDIGDLSALIDRLYISFASLAPCPQ